MKINYFSCHGNQKQLITMSYDNGCCHGDQNS